jgi:hypothetical protein
MMTMTCGVVRGAGGGEVVEGPPGAGVVFEGGVVPFDGTSEALAGAAVVVEGCPGVPPVVLLGVLEVTVVPGA